MKNNIKYYLLLSLAILFSVNTFAKSDKAEKAGWKLGIQTYTFHTVSLQESIDKAHQLGANYVEAFYEQRLGEGMEGKMNFNMDQATRKKLLAYAKSKKVKIIATGVITKKSQEEWEKVFQFASYMGIKIITCEPEYKDLKYVDELANRYKIDVAIHNHPKPSDYWNPDLFLENVKDLSERIGGSADIGHWKRMGIDPVEGIRKYGNRLKMVHLKDIEAKQEGKAAQDDVLPGTGVCNLEGVFQELKRENFKGVFSIEYEGDPKSLMLSVEEYVQFFNNSVNKL